MINYDLMLFSYMINRRPSASGRARPNGCVLGSCSISILYSPLSLLQGTQLRTEINL